MISDKSDNTVKTIAMYLPQYHEIPENSMFWGKGFTDWVSVRNSKPLYQGHNQPRVPLNKNYYDLSKKETIKWQAQIARQYGVYGFGIYHYWFNSKLNLLQKPSELLLSDPGIDINYLFVWDNASWKRSWDNIKFGNDWAPLYEGDVDRRQSGILAQLDYGDEEDWRLHFEYLLPFFKDNRYIKIDGKPAFGFFNQDNDSNTLTKMSEYWNKLAEAEGFPGVAFLGKIKENSVNTTDYHFYYEPEWDAWTWHNQFQRVMNKAKRTVNEKTSKVNIYDYDKVWEEILKNAKSDTDMQSFYGSFVSYDDTPRRGVRGKVIEHGTPDKFRKYYSELLKISKQKNKEFVFLTAWNEWGEGAYLEPDETNQYAYLEALRDAIQGMNQ